MKFEDLITKPLHEYTDEEILEICEKLEPQELSRFNKEVRKSAKPKRPSKKANQAAEDFDKIFHQGLRNDSSE